MIKEIVLNQKIANKLYDVLGDNKVAIDYQSRVNQHKSKNNIISKDDVVLTDENGNYIQWGEIMSNHTGNISTLVKMILLTVLPYIIADSQTQDQVVSIILAITGFLIAYIDAKYPNSLSFLDNEDIIPQTEEAPVGEIRQPIILNEEYVEPIPDTTETNDDGC